MTFRRLASTALLGLVALAPAAASDNWPQWRGPQMNGISSATGLPTTWSKTENVRWRLELPGAAASTPAVWGDRIFLTSADGEDDLSLLAVSTQGEVLWKKKVASGNYDALKGESNAASPSPVTDGTNVWITLGTGDLVSYDFDGKELWRVDLQDRYAEFNYYFGMSSTPLLYGDTLYLLLLHTNQQMVAALDKATGEERWRHERKTDARAECLHSYVSPVMYKDGDKELLLIHGADYITAHDPKTGKEVWRRGGLNPEDNYNTAFRFVASPVVAEGLIVVPSAKNGPVLGLDGDGQQVWRLDRGTPDVPSPLVHDGLVYLSRENGILVVVDAKTGEEVYAERVHGAPHRGSPVYADGKVFLVGMDGTVSVVKAGRTFEVLAQNDVGERLAASPVAVGDTLYLRSYEALYAIAQVEEPQGTSSQPPQSTAAKTSESASR